MATQTEPGYYWAKYKDKCGEVAWRPVQVCLSVSWSSALDVRGFDIEDWGEDGYSNFIYDIIEWGGKIEGPSSDAVTLDGEYWKPRLRMGHLATKD